MVMRGLQAEQGISRGMHRVVMAHNTFCNAGRDPISRAGQGLRRAGSRRAMPIANGPPHPPLPPRACHCPQHTHTSEAREDRCTHLSSLQLYRRNEIDNC